MPKSTKSNSSISFPPLYTRDPSSVSKSIADQSINTVIRRAESPQLHLFSILNLLRIRITPLDRDLTIRISVNEDVECAIAAELREKCNRRSDLSEDSCDFGLDFCFCLFGGCGRGTSGSGVLLVFGGGLGGLGFLDGLEDLNLLKLGGLYT